MFLNFENMWLYLNFYCIIYVTSRRQNPITYWYGWLNWHRFSRFWGQLVLSDLSRFLYAPFKEVNIMFWKLIFLFGTQGCTQSKESNLAFSFRSWCFRPSNIHKSPKHNTNVYDKILKTVVCFLLGNSPASEFYMPTFRNTLFHLHRQVGV
jgi:hypothetical protein